MFRREREQKPDGVLRGGDDRRLGRVRDDDPAAGRGLDVDVVDANARATDHLQPVGPLQDSRVDLRRGADDDRVIAADRLREVAVRVHVDVEALAEQLDPRLGDRLPNENSQAGWCSYVSSARVTATPRSMSAPASASASSIPASAVVMSNTS